MRLVLLALASSALAYQVIVPSGSQGWTSDGPQKLVWQRVETDPLNFSVALTNTDRSVMPINNQFLAALVDGKLGSIEVNPPSGGWPVGGTFRVNLVKDEQSPNSILAQSDEFNITAPKTTTSTSGTTFVATATNAGATTVSASSTETADNSLISSNAASASAKFIGGMAGVLTLLGLTFA